jgi:hypothetical protein
MAVPPRLPNLAPEDMKWVRWATDELTNVKNRQSVVSTNVAAAQQQASTTHTAVATVVEKNAAQEALNPSMPTGVPQVPSTPKLSTDHGTVTVYWDGLVHGNSADGSLGSLMEPAVGFNHVSAYRGATQTGPWVSIGGYIRKDGSIVDVDVRVGATYWYYLVTTDNAKFDSAPSELASITVKGVDLGSLDSDVAAALSRAQTAADAGADAAAAGLDAANAAAAAANSAAMQAAIALQTANGVVVSGSGNHVYYALTPPTDQPVTTPDPTPTPTPTPDPSTTPSGDNGDGTWTRADFTENGDGTWTSPYPDNGDGTWNVGTDPATTTVVVPDGDNGDGTWTRTDFFDNGDGTWIATDDIIDNGDGTWTVNEKTVITTTGGGSGTTTDTGTTPPTGGTGTGTGTGSSTGTNTGSTTPTSYRDGDLWYQLNANGIVIAQWQYMGTVWKQQIISGGVIAAGSISASQIIAGTITAASGVLGDAVITNAKIANLAVSNAKIADLAVNDAKINDLSGNKITAASIVAGKLAADSVTTNNIVAGAIDTNRLAAGAITADKINLGAVNTGTEINRVPQPLTNDVFWSLALRSNNVFTGFSQGAASNAVSNGVRGPGITIDNGGYAFLTPQLKTPASHKLFISITSDDGQGAAAVRQIIGSTYTDSAVPISASGTAFTLAANTESYIVYLNANNSRGYQRYTDATVFETLGNSSVSGQAAQLSPAGLQLFDSNGQLAVDLTTNASQYLSIVDNRGAEPITVAAIDQSGNGAFQAVSADDGFDITGVELTDLNTTTSLFNASPNGSSWDASVPLLDRLGRGAIYDVTWQSQNDNSLTTRYERIAQDQFTLENGRSYQFIVQTAGAQADNGSNVNCYMELQANLSPNADVSSGTVISRCVIRAGQSGVWVMPPVVWAASNSATTIDTVNRVLPAGVPIYWQVNYNMSAAPNVAISIAEFGGSRGLTVVDIGSALLTRPMTGGDTLADVSDSTTSGASSGSTSSGTTTSSKTVTFTAKSSRTWNQGGSNIVTGSGQYTNGAAMYYGHGASNMGSWFGGFTDSSGRSLNSVVGGKTVTSATLTVKNTYTYSGSGATVQFGTGSMSAAPDSIGAPVNNTFSAAFSKGGTKSISLSSGVRSGLKDGSVKSFVIGVSSSVSNYSYFHGATQSAPPKLVVTYH